MSIENQATFYYRNVWDYDEKLKTDVPLTDSIIDGFRAFSALLRRIYQDWRFFETSTAPREKTKIGILANDLENYHNLTYTLDCLYAIATVGALQAEGGIQYLSVDKKGFRENYKKAPAFPFTALERYGFYFRYFKSGRAVDDYKRCDLFSVYYEGGASLLGAIHLLAQLLAAQEKQKEMPKNVAFMLADYAFIFTGKIDGSPLQQGIVSTLGSAGGLWQKLVDVLAGECKLTPDLFFQPYVFPNKTITFKQNKKTICKFYIDVTGLLVRVPLPYEIAKELIANRAALPQSVNRNIDQFDCVDCGKCENRSNIEVFEGIRLCTLEYSNFLTEDSRCLRFMLSSEDEADVICDIVRKILRGK